MILVALEVQKSLCMDSAPVCVVSCSRAGKCSQNAILQLTVFTPQTVGFLNFLPNNLLNSQRKRTSCRRARRESQSTAAGTAVPRPQGQTCCPRRTSSLSSPPGDSLDLPGFCGFTVYRISSSCSCLPNSAATLTRSPHR